MTKKRLLPLFLLCLCVTSCAGGRLKEQQAALEQCQIDAGNLRSLLNGAGGKAGALEAEKSELEGKLSDMESKVKAAEERIASLAKSNKDLSGSLEANKGELQGKVKELIAEKDELGRKLSEAQKEKIIVERSSQKRTDAVRKLAAESAELKARLEKIAGEQKDKSASESAAAEKLQSERAARLARSREDMGSVADVLLKELQSEKAKVSQEGEAISVTLLEPLLFEPQQAKLSDSGVALLDRLGGALHKFSGRNLRVEAHSDNSPIKWELFGRFTSHWDLSSARATAVARHLHEHAGLDPRRLTASGFGEFRPLKGNDTPEGREANRRIVLAVEPAGL